jgi:transcription initiation factor TFIIIB Brf1 subunit/transcription initiation factor TFIIB
MTSDHSETPKSYVQCEACSEENKLGSIRCARCGAVLPKVEGARIDPELRDFNIAQAKLAEQVKQERRKTILIDILTSGGPLLGGR